MLGMGWDGLVLQTMLYDPIWMGGMRAWELVSNYCINWDFYFLDSGVSVVLVFGGWNSCGRESE